MNLLYGVISGPGRKIDQELAEYYRWCSQTSMPVVLMRKGPKFCRIEYSAVSSSLNVDYCAAIIDKKLRDLAVVIGWKKKDKYGINCSSTDIHDSYGFIFRIPLKDGPIVAQMVGKVFFEKL